VAPLKVSFLSTLSAGASVEVTVGCSGGGAGEDALARIAFAGFGSWILRKIINIDDILGIRLGGERSFGWDFHLRSNMNGGRRWLGDLL
jgi:hypothetical protein